MQERCPGENEQQCGADVQGGKHALHLGSDIFDTLGLGFLHVPVLANSFRTVIFQASDTDAGLAVFGGGPVHKAKLRQRQDRPLRKVGQDRQRALMHGWLSLTKLLGAKGLSGFGKC